MNKLVNDVTSRMWLCSECFDVEAQSYRFLFMRNCIAVCRALIILNPAPVFAKEFYIRVVNGLRVEEQIDQEAYISQLTSAYNTFFKEGSFVCVWLGDDA